MRVFLLLATFAASMLGVAPALAQNGNMPNFFCDEAGYIQSDQTGPVLDAAGNAVPCPEAVLQGTTDNIRAYVPEQNSYIYIVVKPYGIYRGWDFDSYEWRTYYRRDLYSRRYYAHRDNRHDYDRSYYGNRQQYDYGYRRQGGWPGGSWNRNPGRRDNGLNYDNHGNSSGGWNSNRNDRSNNGGNGWNRGGHDWNSGHSRDSVTIQRRVESNNGNRSLEIERRQFRNDARSSGNDRPRSQPQQRSSGNDHQSHSGDRHYTLHRR